MADRVAIFNDGRIVQVGAPEDIYERPRTRFVADFVGSSNVLPPGIFASSRRTAALGEPRPEKIEIGAGTKGAGGQGAAGKVVAVHYQGATTRIAVIDPAHGSDV
jgi:putative spermidine/putrescine transport system ATP-binding protein